MNYTLLDREILPRDGHIYEFQGVRFPDTEVSFIWVDMPPGEAIRLHKHPYQEIFIVLEGRATYTIGAKTLEVQASQVILVSPEVPHKFSNTGDGPLKQIDIHVSRQFITDWLEE